MAIDPTSPQSTAGRVGFRLWLICWRTGLAVLGVAGLLAVVMGFVLLGLHLLRPATQTGGDVWMYLATIALGLLVVAIVVKGWRIRSRNDIYEDMAQSQSRIERLEKWINK